MTDDPRFDDTVGLPQIAGLVVAFKALLVRAGGRVEITEAELEHARTLLARVDVTPEVMTVELVDGDPPDTPRFAAEGAMTFAEVLEGLRAALAGLETVPEADLDEPTRRLRDNTRAMLDRYDRDERDA